MDQRLQFVAEYLTGLYSMTELTASYGISRRIGYYWVDRYERTATSSRALAVRIPVRTPRRPAIVERIRAARAAHPSWGAGKLRDWLSPPGTRRRAWPCRDTVP